MIERYEQLVRAPWAAAGYAQSDSPASGTWRFLQVL